MTGPAAAAAAARPDPYAELERVYQDITSSNPTDREAQASLILQHIFNNKVLRNAEYKTAFIKNKSKWQDRIKEFSSTRLYSGFTGRIRQFFNRLGGFFQGRGFNTYSDLVIQKNRDAVYTGNRNWLQNIFR